MTTTPSPELVEALDPTTPGERLDELLGHADPEVQRAAMRNPSLPGEVHIGMLTSGAPDAWANPAVSLTLLVHPLTDEALREARQRAVVVLDYMGGRPDLRETYEREILGPLQMWWQTEPKLLPLLAYLSLWLEIQPPDGGWSIAQIAPPMYVRATKLAANYVRQRLSFAERWGADLESLLARIEAWTTDDGDDLLDELRSEAGNLADTITDELAMGGVEIDDEDNPDHQLAMALQSATYGNVENVADRASRASNLPQSQIAAAAEKVRAGWREELRREYPRLPLPDGLGGAGA